MVKRISDRTMLTALAFLSVIWLAAVSAQADTTAIEVSAPDRAYRDCPVTVEVVAPESAKSAVLRETRTGQTVPTQLWRDGGKAMLTWIVSELPKGSTASYGVTLRDSAPSAGDGVAIRMADDGAAEVSIGGRMFTRYVTKGGPKPYCYPIFDADGNAVTRDWPMKDVESEAKMKDHDHPHHRSLWFTYDDVNGQRFWMEGEKAGKTVHRSFEAAQSGPAMGRLHATTDWIGSDGQKVCEDVRDIRFYNVAAGRLFDWTITIKASEGPVKFGDTKEGMFGFRVATSMKVDARKFDPNLGGAIVNANGLTNADAWGKPANWVDYVGPVAGKTVGIAMLDHPASFRHPTYWHVRTYGLFCANPFGLHDFPDGKGKDGSHTIAQDDSITFRYRIFIHSGTTEQARIADVYEQFANPPKITLR